ncbi:hypothetical protein L3Q82_010070, partial [Scortum barcoo]
PFRGGLAGVFWIIVLLQNPSSFQLEIDGWTFSFRIFGGRQQNSWFHLSQQVFQVLKQQNSPRPSHYHHHILLLWFSSLNSAMQAIFVQSLSYGGVMNTDFN